MPKNRLYLCTEPKNVSVPKVAECDDDVLVEEVWQPDEENVTLTVSCRSYKMCPIKTKFCASLGKVCIFDNTTIDRE